MTNKHSRPWYVSDHACDDYRTAFSDGGDFRMLKALKLLRSIIVNLGIISLGLYSISTGADPTIIGIVALTVLGGYNGLEFSDYMALLQAYQEIDDERNQ